MHRRFYGKRTRTNKKEVRKNPILECLRIQKKFYPELFHKFDEVKDPRNQSYIDYSNRVMLGTLFFKSIGGIASMQDMTRMFNDENDEQVVSNLYSFLGSGKQDYLPHHVTLNEYLERLKLSELEEIQQDIVYRMIRRKTFNSAKVLGKWLVIEDGTDSRFYEIAL